MHFEGHLKAINMLADSLERRINTSLENKYLLSMFALEKSLIYILNSISSNNSLLERMKSMAEKLGFDNDQAGILEDLSSKISSVTGAPRFTPSPRRPYGCACIHRQPQSEPTHQEVHYLDGSNWDCEPCCGSVLNERGPASSEGGG
jgi:hypothetical protein